MKATQIKERPILFSGPMVRAILAGRKTRTMRVMKPQPVEFQPGLFSYKDKVFVSHDLLVDHLFHEVYGTDGTPYGSVWSAGGDRLWVRETFSYYRPFGSDVQPGAPVIYRADADHCNQYPCQLDGQMVLVSAREPWKPSIHMPRKASRITLELTDVEVQRVQDITEEQAIAEGCEAYELSMWGGFHRTDSGRRCFCHSGDGDKPAPEWMEHPERDVISASTARESFQRLWNRINHNRGFGWDVNPWCWALTFKVVSA